MELIGGFLIFIGVWRLVVMMYGLIWLGRRRELDLHSRLMMQVAAAEALAVILLGISIWRGASEGAQGIGTLWTTAALIVGVAAVIRLVSWFNRVRKPMDPVLIEAAFEAERLLNGIATGGAETSAGNRGDVQEVLRRLRDDLAPYRPKAVRRDS